MRQCQKRTTFNSQLLKVPCLLRTLTYPFSSSSSNYSFLRCQSLSQSHRFPSRISRVDPLISTTTHFATHPFHSQNELSPSFPSSTCKKRSSNSPTMPQRSRDSEFLLMSGGPSRFIGSRPMAPWSPSLDLSLRLRASLKFLSVLLLSTGLSGSRLGLL